MGSSAIKYLSLVLVFLIVALAWWVSQDSGSLSTQQMARMNGYIIQYMTETVRKKIPRAEKIKFSSIHMEVVEQDREMKAHFKFSYEDHISQTDIQKVHRKGYFTITSQDGDQWEARVGQIGDTRVEFGQPLSIQVDP